MSSKPKHNKKHKRSTREWGPAQWSVEYGALYRERLNEHGQPEFEWLEADESSRLGLEHVPRGEPESLVGDIQAYHIGDIDHGDDGGDQSSSYNFQDSSVPEGYVAGSEHNTSPLYTHASLHAPQDSNYAEDVYYDTPSGVISGVSEADQGNDEPHAAAFAAHPYGGVSDAQSSYGLGDSVHSQGRRKGKDVAQDHVDQHDDIHTGTRDRHAGPRKHHTRKGKEKEEDIDLGSATGLDRDAAAGYDQPPGTGAFDGEGGYEDDDDDDDDGFSKAAQDSRNTNYRVPGEPSTARHQAYGESSEMYSDGLDTAEEEYSATLEPIPSQYHDANTFGDAGGPGPQFKLEPSWRFEPGCVFKINWPEPRGFSDTHAEEALSDTVTRDQNSPFYSGIRRFIIVATDDGHHSTCVPILTYGGRGCKKTGVQSRQHGIVYSQGQKPRLLDNEPRLGYKPVAVRMTGAERLSKESRVNYSKLQTIEHNSMVHFIGAVEGTNFETVRQAVDECWISKQHQTKQHKSGKKSKRH